MVFKYKRTAIVVLLVLAVISCRQEKKGTSIGTKEMDHVIENEYYGVKYRDADIGDVKVIYIYYNYWDGMGNNTFGVDQNTIDLKIKEIFPDSIKNLGDYHFGYMPNKTIIDQDALNYLGQYIISNCDTVVEKKHFSNAETIYQIFLIGENGVLECMYGDPDIVSNYFQGMIQWIEHYPEIESLNVVLPKIRPMIKNKIISIE